MQAAQLFTSSSRRRRKNPSIKLQRAIANAPKTLMRSIDSRRSSCRNYSLEILKLSQSFLLREIRVQPLTRAKPWFW